MSYGIRVRNDYLTTQIDHNYKNYSFVQIIPVTVHVPTASIGETGLVQLTVPGINALVGVRCQALHYVPLGSFFDGANWLYTFKFLTSAGDITETVQFYVFNALGAGSFSSWGIRIRNPTTGEIAFHSDMRPLYMDAKNPCTVGYTGTPGRVYCPIVTRLCFINNFYAGLGYFYMPFGLRCNSSGIETFQFTMPRNYILFATTYDPGEYAVIDVTGL